MSNDTIFGGPLKAEIKKSPYEQTVTVTGDGISHRSSSGNLVKSVSMALNEVYRPEVTLDDRYDSVQEHLRERRDEIQEKRDGIQEAIEDVEDSATTPGTFTWELEIVRDAMDDYLKQMDDALEVLELTQDHAFGNNENSEAED